MVRNEEIQTEISIFCNRKRKLRFSIIRVQRMESFQFSCYIIIGIDKNAACLLQRMNQIKEIRSSLNRQENHWTVKLSLMRVFSKKSFVVCKA